MKKSFAEELTNDSLHGSKSFGRWRWSWPRRCMVEFHSLNSRMLTFAYCPTRPCKNIFHGFSLKVHSGETVASGGPSGGGKSTTADLVERFYDPQNSYS
mmetsp:Transcript_18335/g.27214  ORF Transcript_18335/g.27214 Transcript_18335/m.27214 type:complete len:99 (-) Transcript_18335:759-1055(-)